MKRLVTCLILAAAVLPALAQAELKGTASDLTKYLSGLPKIVKVTGEAEVRVPAQRAVMMLRVSTEHRSLQEALRINADIRSRLTAQLTRQGIPAASIQPSKFSSTPRYGLFSEKAKSYRVDNVVRVSVRDEKEFQEAAGVVDTYAEVQYGGVDFEYADKEALKMKVIADACENAAQHRKLFEQQLELKLTPVRFAEGGVAQVDAAPLDPSLRKGYSGGPALASSLAPEETVSSFGELVFRAKVEVEYVAQPANP